ncbi:MAG: hypothetical protein DRG83_14715 [Deltaproteobacteria bacterium]|nr:MAG: hypothetical protein DRG83_14715 [Deltaproteobacteria bacterium]
MLIIFELLTRMNGVVTSLKSTCPQEKAFFLISYSLIKKKINPIFASFASLRFDFGCVYAALATLTSLNGES